MTHKFLLSTLLLGFYSQCFAYYEEHYTCLSQSGRTQINIDAVNRPDFEFLNYNSTSADNSNEYGDIRLQISLDGKKVSGQVRILSATDGISQDITEKTDDGKTCRVGVMTTGIKAKAVVSVAGKSLKLQFNCTNQMALPGGAIDCQ